MPRPTVLHCLRAWPPDDETSLAEIVGACSGTRPVVVCRERRPSERLAEVIAVNLDADRPWLPAPGERRRTFLLGAAVARFGARLIHVHDAAWGPAAERVAALARLPLAATWPDGASGDGVPSWVRRARLIAVVTPDALVSARAAGLGAARMHLLDAAVDLGCEREGDDPLVVAAAELRASPGARAAVLRAQAAGRLVVVVGEDDASRDLLGDGGAVTVGQPEDAAGAVEGVLGDRDRRREMLRRGRCNVTLRHELGARAADLDAAYRAVIAGRPVPELPDRLQELPTVSVVIPSYNRRRLLGRALDALESQTYPSELIEVVVVDNGSTDATGVELRGRTPPWKLTVLRNEVNTSAAAARNRAVAATSGQVVAFTDSDCRPVPTWVEALVAGFTTAPTIVQGRTVPDADNELGPLDRSQSVPWEYGLYETCNVAYDRESLRLAGEPAFGAALPARMQELLGPRIGRQAFGEDAELAWRAKRAGARSRFAGRAVVRHHVFESDFRYLVDRAALLAGFPVLVRTVPELRHGLLRWRLFLTADRPLVWAAAAGAVVGIRSPRRLVLALPYVIRSVRPWRRRAHGRLAALPRTAMVDAVGTAALAYGSVRARRVVL